MSQSVQQSTAGTRVSILPVSSGNNNPIARKMLEQNQSITMLNAQAQADTAYDPPAGPRPTQAVFVESFGFQTGIATTTLFVAGILSIIYGIVV